MVSPVDTTVVDGRLDLDRYWTPAGYLGPLLARHTIRGRVLEPSAGEGAIVKALIRHGVPAASIVTRDLVPGPHVQVARNMTDPAAWAEIGPVEWVVMNPPFYAAESFVEQALGIARQGVIWLARLSYVEPTVERAPHLLRTPPERILVLPRHKFRTDRKSTDSVTCAWFMRGPAIRPGVEVVGRDEFWRYQGGKRGQR